jgi:hypothetical protein
VVGAMKHPQLHDAVAAVLAGESQLSAARRFNIPRTSLRDAVAAARGLQTPRNGAQTPAPAATPPLAPQVQTVVDETPLDILAADGVEQHDLHARAAGGSVAMDDAAMAPAAAAPMSADQVVDMFEGLVGVVVRVTVTSKGGEWSERLETACRFTSSERGRLIVTAPYVAKYVGDALASSPYVGIGLFALSAFEVVASRIALAKLATRPPQPAHDTAAEQPAAFEGPPMAATPAPSLADAPAARGFGGNA